MSNEGASGLTTILGIAALVVTAGFLFWLYQRSASVEPVEPVMEDTTATESALTLDDLRADPEGVAGEAADLDSVEVASRLGRGAFTLRLDSASLYPVLMAPDLIQRGTQIYGGDMVSIWGNFYPLNDSIRSVWVERGAVDAEQEGAIPGRATFLLADSLQVY